MILEIAVQLAPEKAKGVVATFDVYPADTKLLLDPDGDYYSDENYETAASIMFLDEFPELQAVVNGNVIKAKLVIEYERKPGWYKVERHQEKQVARWDGVHWETLISNATLNDDDFQSINEIPINLED